MGTNNTNCRITDEVADWNRSNVRQSKNASEKVIVEEILNPYRPAQSVHELGETQNSWARGLQAASTQVLEADAEAA
ncbi:MAG: hypothetical protein KJ070_13195 [Verrucomicrobia bacterium]|nr:hypothetical protein [Verrucomicrobiota bacterium]